MDFNLIREKWIPVRRRDGTRERIAPWEITTDWETNPIVALDAPRPDFNGALIQFLIGLVQTTAAPKDDLEWEDRFYEPMSPELLRGLFATVAHAFELGGDGPRFMQDIDSLGGRERPIEHLLIDAPGVNTVENNRDHFVKRRSVEMLCPSCGATALFALQTDAPGEGAGHRTSLRGAGPLTTLVLPGSMDSSTLWQMIWLNVLEEGVFLRTCGNASKTADSDRFPWLAHTRSSEKNGGCETTPEDIHPTQMFWGMPRRIRLEFDKREDGACDICGGISSIVIRWYRAKNYGVNYSGPWLHPLSPHIRKDGVPEPVHARPGGVSYRHWLGLVQEDRNLGKEPARVIHHFRENRQRDRQQFRIWAFGYDIPKGQAKARCWYESAMPLTAVPSAIQPVYENAIANLVMGAVKICENTRIAVKRAWHGKPEVNSANIVTWTYADIKKLPNDERLAKDKILRTIMHLSLFLAIDTSFWQNTEKDFYKLLKQIALHIETTKLVADYKEWHNHLCNVSLKLFDDILWNKPIDISNPRNIVLARRALRSSNHDKEITADLFGFSHP